VKRTRTSSAYSCTAWWIWLPSLAICALTHAALNDAGRAVILSLALAALTPLVGGAIIAAIDAWAEVRALEAPMDDAPP
jgi:hypothetical protein